MVALGRRCYTSNEQSFQTSSDIQSILESKSFLRLKLNLTILDCACQNWNKKTHFLLKYPLFSPPLLLILKRISRT